MKHGFMSLSLSKKLITTLLLAGLLPTAVVTIEAVMVAHSEVSSMAYHKLEAVREIKTEAIKRYFKQAESAILNEASLEKTREAMRSFGPAFASMGQEVNWDTADIPALREELGAYYRREFGQEFSKRNDGRDTDVEQLLASLDDEAVVAQTLYIQRNNNALGEKHLLDAADGASTYHTLHRRYHPEFRNYLTRFGLYDIFLVDIDSGNVVYTVFKELDFATSLLDGPYRDSNLGEAFRRASQLDAGDVVIVDYAPYLPSYNAAASFIATPIFDGSKRIGVMIFQLPIEPINAIMGSQAGMGEGGQSFLIGPDRLMRSDSPLDEEKSVKNSFAHPEKGSVETEAATLALKGERGYATMTDYHGHSSLTAYAPIDLGHFKWGIIAEVDEDEGLAGVTSMTQKLLLASGVIAVLLALFAWWLSRVIAKPILELGATIQQASDRGDFSLSVNNDYNDEIGKTARAFNALARNLASSISDANRSLEAMSQSRFDTLIDARYPGELGTLANGVNRAVQQVREAHEAEAAKAREVMIIKQALDVSATSVMIADDNLNLVYLNHAGLQLMRDVEPDLRKELPHFNANSLMGSNIDIFHKNPSHQRQMLKNLTSTYKTEISVSGLTFHLAATAIRDASGQFMGAVVEWQNLTAERIVEQQIDAVIDAAARGDFNRKLDSGNRQGFLRTVSEGLNRLLKTTEVAIQDISRVFAALAQGDLSQRIERDYEGEFATLKADANQTVDTLRQTMQDILMGASEISRAAREISSGNADLSARTEEQASSLEETASSMEQMTQVVKQSEQNAMRANDNAQSSVGIARRGDETVRQTIAAMHEISQASEKISNIIGVIDELAFQTNLLALNAAVEAARAGEAGRGFAVVAAEVRNLAQRSASAAKEIKNLIRDSEQKVSEGSALVEVSGSMLAEIVKGIETVGEMMQGILTSAREQSTGISHVNTAVTQMDSLTQQNAALVEEVSAASESMAEQAQRLNERVSFFRV